MSSLGNSQAGQDCCRARGLAPESLDMLFIVAGGGPTFKKGQRSCPRLQNIHWSLKNGMLYAGLLPATLFFAFWLPHFLGSRLYSIATVALCSRFGGFLRNFIGSSSLCTGLVGELGREHCFPLKGIRTCFPLKGASPG